MTSLAARLRAKRTLLVPVGEAMFTLVLPAPWRWRCAFADNQGDPVRALRALLDEALIGWEGVTESYLLGDGEAALTCSDAHREMLLDHRMDITSALGEALAAEFRKRQEAAEEQRKN
jgi:hypothetical protein